MLKKGAIIQGRQLFQGGGGYLSAMIIRRSTIIRGNLVARKDPVHVTHTWQQMCLINITSDLYGFPFEYKP